MDCRLLHHGVAASPSSCKALLCLPDEQIAYASHGILNIARNVARPLLLWNVQRTLRTSSLRSKRAAGVFSRVITAISLVKPVGDSSVDHVVLCGFSDGTITSWRKCGDEWWELILVHDSTMLEQESFPMESVKDLDGQWVVCGGQVSLAVSFCAASGAKMCEFKLVKSESESSLVIDSVVVRSLVSTPANTIHMKPLKSDPSHLLYLVGSASPRYNMIHVFVGPVPTSEQTTFGSPHYCGSLKGHEDWITCFIWHSSCCSVPIGGHSVDASDMLASSSQDAKIRLWKFTTYSAAESSTDPQVENENLPEEGEDINPLDEDEEGEARMEIQHGGYKTLVTLEALLIGHEERVTSVTWHPDPQPIYGRKYILLSSSMDRSIFIWGEQESGIWTPVSRVGSAGGILGGPLGSSLLGFINVKIDPAEGNWILGHAYGGSIHCYALDKKVATADNDISNEDGSEISTVEGNRDKPDTIEERVSMYCWRAQPCITGHFNGVTDLSWEAMDGSYLISVGADQTCRILAPLSLASRSDGQPIWTEVGRPQVHGHNISTVVSVSTPSRPHFLASGSDEKEIRGFDGTSSFLQWLKSSSFPPKIRRDDPVERVERAYIPSLGLSNKSSAVDGAEQDNTKYETTSSLPLERDLGALSTWPESHKFFGHDTEIMRLASNTVAHNASPETQRLFLASSAKARNVDDACIRIWDAYCGTCLQTLTGGHRSTVASLDFSPDGQYLASSGKDRRLCIWKHVKKESPSGQPADEGDIFQLEAAVDGAHKRIVWSVHFCPNDAGVCVSGSRDGTVKVWRIVEAAEGTELKCMHSFSPMATDEETGKSIAVTAVAFAPSLSESESSAESLLSIGLENGLIELWMVQLNSPDSGDVKPRIVYQVPLQLGHIANVTKLAWKPQNDAGDELLLASCSSDHGTRIFSIPLKAL